MKSNEIGDLHIGQFDLIFDEGILANVVANTKPLEYQGFRLIFEHLEIHMPYSKSNDTHSADKRLLPATCREQSLTYGGSCFIKVKLMYKKRVLLHEYKPAGVFPIMLKSKMCHLAKNSEASLYALGEDPRECGGYFIVGGYDKLVRFHIAYKRNHMFVLKNKSKDSAYSDYSCMIRSVGSDEIGQKNEIKYCADGNIHFKVYLRKRIYLIPVILILRALANTTDDEIYRSLGSDKRILQMLTMNKAYDAFSKREALVYLGTRFQTILRIEDPLAAGKEFVRMAILVHLEKFEDKYALIIDSIKKLLRCVGGEILPDDIDLTANHELYTEAQLIPLCVREKLEEIKKTFQTKILAAVRTRISTGDSTTSLNHSEIMELSDDFSEEQITKILKIFNNLDFGIGAKVNRFLSMGVVTTNSCSDLLQTAGFTILAERINYWRFASHFQSVSRGAFFSNLKITTVRKLRPESWGFLCPIHTPDGSPCGLLLHLSKSCHLVSRTAPIDPSVFYDFGLVPLSRGFNPHVPLYFNGRLLGTAADAPALVEKLRSFRSIHGLCMEVAYEHGPKIFEAIYVYSSFSGMMRRVFNVKSGRTEWIGPKEQVYLDISLSENVINNIADINITEGIDTTNMNGASMNTNNMNTKHMNSASMNTNNYNVNVVDAFNDRKEIFFTYREIDNMDIFSSVGACITYADYNPSPRNIYQCQMAKQAMGISAYNHHLRTDNKVYSINYLQDPLVRTKNYETFAPFPIGFNCIVAVISYTAYDMEDAVVINKSAQERGLFNAFIYKNEKYELERDAEIETTPHKGDCVSTGDVLLTYTSDSAGKVVKRYEGSETGHVEEVRIFSNGVNPCVTVTLRIKRNPNIGDKFCSRHGQKGVCSYLWPEIDMPFTEQGLRPDIIINPHAFPSRMTIGMLLESIAGKGAVSLGKIQDGTPFEKNTFFTNESISSINNINRNINNIIDIDNMNINDRNNMNINDRNKEGLFRRNNNGINGDTNECAKSLGEELMDSGFNYYGNEPMYSGITGTEFRTDIFIGCVYYQRLRHMVNDKFQVRTSGAVVATTRQPVGGRKNKGGVRFGEMERDALIAHGASYMLKDRLMDCSDKAEFIYCQECRSFLFSDGKKCLCGSSVLKRTEMPYVFKYLCCELLAMNIKVQIDLE